MKKTILLIVTIFITAIGNAQIVNIPDANFKSYLVGRSDINTNGDNEIQVSEAQSFNGLIDVTYRDITDLTGIESFINLRDLNITHNNISNINLSSNTALESFTALYCQLTDLDISNNSQLTYLNCGHNNIQNINTTNASNLLQLYCHSNQIQNLDLTTNTSLIELSCTNNNIISLDVDNNINLTKLHCNFNDLNSLNLSQNINLTKLICSDNPNLSYINLKNGNNANLDVSGSYYSSQFDNLPNLQDVCVDALNTNLTNYIISETGHNVNFYTDCSLASVDNDNLATFDIFPNPAKNNFSIKTEQEINSISIYNGAGQLLIYRENTKEIDISKLSKGIYFVKISTKNQGVAMQKIIKE